MLKLELKGSNSYSVTMIVHLILAKAFLIFDVFMKKILINSDDKNN